MLLVGEPFWRSGPARPGDGRGLPRLRREDFRDLPGLVDLFGELGWDLVEMVLADQDSWDRYVAAQWFNMRDMARREPGATSWPARCVTSWTPPR